jgi:hypothetical protein
VPKLLGSQLDLGRCPHCNVDRPRLVFASEVKTSDFAGKNPRLWRIYQCGRCGGVVLAAAPGGDQEVTELYPQSTRVDESIPPRAREYLDQALNSLSSPAGAVMLAASAVDSMLKAKGLKEGTLYTRVDQAAAQHLITLEMATWAHEVRLDANDQRHADDDAPLPTTADARKCVDFALALGQFMFVLPASVTRGIDAAKQQ